MLVAPFVSTWKNMEHPGDWFHKLINLMPNVLEIVDVLKHVMGKQEIELTGRFVLRRKKGATRHALSGMPYGNSADVCAEYLPPGQCLMEYFGEDAIPTTKVQRHPAFR